MTMDERLAVLAEKLELILEAIKRDAAQLNVVAAKVTGMEARVAAVEDDNDQLRSWLIEPPATRPGKDDEAR